MDIQQPSTLSSDLETEFEQITVLPSNMQHFDKDRIPDDLYKDAVGRIHSALEFMNSKNTTPTFSEAMSKIRKFLDGPDFPIGQTVYVDIIRIDVDIPLNPMYTTLRLTTDVEKYPFPYSQIDAEDFKDLFEGNYYFPFLNEVYPDADELNQEIPIQTLIGKQAIMCYGRGAIYNDVKDLAFAVEIPPPPSMMVVYLHFGYTLEEMLSNFPPIVCFDDPRFPCSLRFGKIEKTKNMWPHISFISGKCPDPKVQLIRTRGFEPEALVFDLFGSLQHFPRTDNGVICNGKIHIVPQEEEKSRVRHRLINHWDNVRDRIEKLMLLHVDEENDQFDQ